MKAIIFGVNGQDRTDIDLSKPCSKRQIEVIGISRSGPWTHGDVSPPEILEKLIRNHQPAMIFHLAAASSTKHDVREQENFKAEYQLLVPNPATINF